jgi:hypothetical protein
MVDPDLQTVAKDAATWTLRWLENELSAETESEKAAATDALGRLIVSESVGIPFFGGVTAVAAASTAVEIFRLLHQRDPQAAEAYVAQQRAALDQMYNRFA